MTEERLRYLLDKLHHQTMSAGETVELERWYQHLQVQHPPLISELDQDESALFREQMWQDLQGRSMPDSTAPVRLFQMSPTRWMVAAAVLVIAGLVAIRLAQAPLKQRNSTGPVIAQTTSDTIVNHSGSDSAFTLPDGSRVVLTAHSALSYSAGASAPERAVFLVRGKAFFDVCKNPKRPFVVYSQTLSTTALGTSFTVSQENVSEVTVKLHDGKVVVQSVETGKHFKPVYLTPGYQLSVNTGTMLASVSRYSHPSIKAAKQPSIQALPLRGTRLTFDQEPLTQVFAQLSKLYRQEIFVDLPEADRFDLSATILSTDSLGAVLGKIARLNGLSVRKTATGYTICK